MTARTISIDHRMLIFRAKVIEQAADLMYKAHLSAGEVCELYMGAGIETALAACPDREVIKMIRQLADDIESGRYLN